MIAIPNMSKPKHCGMCEFQDMCACILLREPIPNNLNVLPDCPLIDIVRCGECKYFNEETHGCNRNPSVNAWWESDFCSYGERRSE